MRLLICVGALIIAGCAPQAGPAPSANITPPSASVDDGAIFKVSDRVRIRSRSGTFKPEDTGHTAEVNGSPGKTGTVLQDVIGGWEIARVRFDAQSWDEFPPTGAPPVALKAFEATIHISYLQKVS